MSRGRRKPPLIPISPSKRADARRARDTQEQQDERAYLAAREWFDQVLSILNEITIRRRITIFFSTLLLIAAATAPAGPRFWTQNWRLLAVNLGQLAFFMTWMVVLRLRVRRRLRTRPIDWSSVIRLERWAATLASFYLFVATKLWVYSENIGPWLAQRIQPYLPIIGHYLGQGFLKILEWVASAIVGAIALNLLSRKISLLRNAVSAPDASHQGGRSS